MLLHSPGEIACPNIIVLHSNEISCPIYSSAYRERFPFHRKRFFYLLLVREETEYTCILLLIDGDLFLWLANGGLDMKPAEWRG